MNINNDSWGFFVDIEKIEEPTINFEKDYNKKYNFDNLYKLIKITSNIIFFIGASYLIFYII
jgi:hypothetical protein